MSIPDKYSYLNEVMDEMQKQWPDNKIINIVCHGHSVPAGYFATPYVNTFGSYPHLLHQELKQRFPFAVINVIVTAIGGENSSTGSQRFKEEVLNHRPKVVTIDYGSNDRSISLQESEKYWRLMIEQALHQNIKVILLTPTWEKSFIHKDDNWHGLLSHAEQIRALANEYGIGLSDSLQSFLNYISSGGDLSDLLSHVNHPNLEGHRLITRELARWFMAR